MPGVAFVVALVAAVVLAVPALADDAPPPPAVQFTLGRLIHPYPDAHRRIGIRSSCDDPAGCSVAFALLRTDTQPQAVLGRAYVMLIANTKETDYIVLSKRTVALLARRKSLKVTVSAEVSDATGNKATFTKDAVLTPPPVKKKR